MVNKKTIFRETRAYPVVFMLLITIVFVGILAVLYQLTLHRVQTYRETQLKSMVLRTFDLPENDVEANFTKFISLREEADLTYYEATKDSVLLGFCFPISGSGLWSTIQALLAVTPDFKNIIDIEIVSQNETPGLGGRITESWFKAQFKGKLLVENHLIQQFTLIPENDQIKGFEINQITGATASSKAVVDMIYKNVLKYSKEMRAEL
ncbi:MAG TPA: FMN-binding protein [Candidatus Cloacimonadota bacterium]|nr:FMN-binding protein [Candidatus Cloacimonadota bacterium]